MGWKARKRCIKKERTKERKPVTRRRYKPIYAKLAKLFIA
jgi:hypothetical protein